MKIVFLEGRKAKWTGQQHLTPEKNFPTRKALEVMIAVLEGGGAAGSCVGNGIAAGQ